MENNAIEITNIFKKQIQDILGDSCSAEIKERIYDLVFQAMLDGINSGVRSSRFLNPEVYDMNNVGV